jgi:hypothetical protein
MRHHDESSLESIVTNWLESSKLVRIFRSRSVWLGKDTVDRDISQDSSGMGCLKCNIFVMARIIFIIDLFCVAATYTDWSLVIYLTDVWVRCAEVACLVISQH